MWVVFWLKLVHVRHRDRTIVEWVDIFFSTDFVFDDFVADDFFVDDFVVDSFCCRQILLSTDFVSTILCYLFKAPTGQTKLQKIQKLNKELFVAVFRLQKKYFSEKRPFQLSVFSDLSTKGLGITKEIPLNF